MQTTHYLTPERKAFILAHYPEKGGRYCADALGIPYSTVNNCASRAGLKVSEKVRYYRDNVSVSDFETMASPVVCYFLGLFFADGWLDRKRVNLSLVTSDYADIEKHLLGIVRKATVYRRQRRHWKPSTSFAISSVQLSTLLNERGFKGQSLRCALSIPPHNLRHFLRGYLDGDGHLKLYRSGSKHRPRLQLAGPIEFDWTILEAVLGKGESGGCKIHCRRYTSKRGHRSSALTLSHLPTIVAFCDWVYGGYDRDHVGFSRKHRAYVELREALAAKAQTSSRKTLTTPRFDDASVAARLAHLMESPTDLPAINSSVNAAR